VVAGSVDEVVDQLAEFCSVVGDFGTLLYCDVDFVDEALGKRSMELMATDVMPALNARLAGAAAV
jgi:alkanesulfonate monooxygenase SsuD/methylene tetrahydromethanopterin reductase-like flavin-dependent oxidoreductase (luciferase family)